MVKNLNSFFFISLLFVVSSCSSYTGASETGEQFYNFLTEHKYKNTIDLLHKDILIEHGEKKIVENFESMLSERGDLKSYERTKVDAKTNDGKTITNIQYKVIYEKETFNEAIRCVKVRKKYKIVEYDPNTDNN